MGASSFLDAVNEHVVVYDGAMGPDTKAPSLGQIAFTGLVCHHPQAMYFVAR